MAKLLLEAEPKECILKLTVEGLATVAELDGLIQETPAKVKAFGGKPFGILVDLRNMAAAFSPEATERIKVHQNLLMKLGLRKSAEIMASASAALQLNRVARESGMAHMLQRFTDVAEARRWLAEPTER